MQADNSPSTPTKKPPRFLLYLALGLGIFVGFVCFCGNFGGLFPFDPLAHLIVGWPFYLHRTLPEMRMNPAGLATALVCLAGLFLGLHLFLRAMVRPASSVTAASTSARPWHLSWTATILAGVVLIFAAGIAAVGIFH